MVRHAKPVSIPQADGQAGDRSRDARPPTHAANNFLIYERVNDVTLVNAIPKVFLLKNPVRFS
jgi:hypothetical protein